MKSKKPTFEEVAFDATFKIVGVEVLQQEEKYAWCSFCGGRLRHPVLLERNDGKAFRVGKTCIGRVGLELTGSEKTVVKRKRPKVAEPKPRVEEPKVEEGEDYFSLDDVFED